MLVNFLPFPVLCTSRLILRQVDSNDIDEIFFLRSDEDMMRFLDRYPAESEEEALYFVQKITNAEQKNESITWALTRGENSPLIGTICFWQIQKDHFRAELGYALLSSFQHMGFMQEAITAVLDYGFNVMKLHSVEANVKPSNHASIKLLERNGFKKEGYFKENYFFNNRSIDSVIYSLPAPKQLK